MKTNQQIKKTLLELLEEAIKRLYSYDRQLLYYKVSERCICSRLAFHLENIMRQKYDSDFQGYNADVEYDRKKGDPKCIDSSKKRHVCDLLIHRRGFNGPTDNLLALEMKVHNNFSKVQSDFKRLHDIVQYGNEHNQDYAHGTLLGVFLRIQEFKYKMRIFDVELNNGEPGKEIVVKI